MVFVNGIESRLPGRSVLEITVSFTPGHRPDGRPVWKFAAVAVERSRAMSPAERAEGLSTLEGIASFGIVPVRN